MSKKIYIYNRGFLHSYLLNLIIPAIRCFIHEHYEVHLLSGGNDFSQNNYFDKNAYRIKKIQANKIFWVHLVQLIKYLRKINSNKLIVMTENQAIIVGLIKKIFRLHFSLILYKQGAIAEERYFLSQNKLIKIFFHCIEKISLDFADEIIFVSNNMKKYYNDTFSWRKKSYIIYNKIVNNISPSVKKEPRKDYVEIVYSGSLSKWQHIDYIIKIFHNLSRYKFLKFKILTQNNLDLINHNIDNLTITSSTPNEIVNELSKSDIGIIIRDSNILNKVASPLKVGEYLSAGLPIILTPNIGDYSRLIIESKLGCIVTMSSINEDTDKIIKFISNYKGNREYFQRNAFLFGKKYFFGNDEYKRIL